MDPNVALATLRDLSRRATSGEPWNDSSEASDLALEMAEAWEALDEWLTKGGFTPAAWVTNPEPRFVDSVSVNVSVGVNNVDDHMLVALGDRSAKLSLWQAGWLHRQIGRRLNMQPTGFIDVGNTL